MVLQAKQILNIRHCRERALDRLQCCNLLVYKTLQDSLSFKKRPYDRGVRGLLLHSKHRWCGYMGLHVQEHPRTSLRRRCHGCCSYLWRFNTPTVPLFYFCNRCSYFWHTFSVMVSVIFLLLFESLTIVFLFRKCFFLSIFFWFNFCPLNIKVQFQNVVTILKFLSRTCSKHRIRTKINMSFVELFKALKYFKCNLAPELFLNLLH